MGGTCFRCGARGSRLSVAQAMEGIRFMSSRIDGFKARLLRFETPGDRDLATPIEKSAPDFFTRDLDEAVRVGRIDFAVHSAKDLPDGIADDLDWFWLPCREDPRDCLVTRAGKSAMRSPFRIGVSSERRASYARSRYPKSRLLPIRGAVDSRLAQLDEGRYDAVVMALAGLRRLFPGWKGGVLPSGRGGFNVEPISLDELRPPEGQGYLAIVYRKGDMRLDAVRREFVKAVRFTSAGVGDAGTITVRGMRDLEEADVVLADGLCGFSGGDAVAGWVDVGKRCGAHSMDQGDITKLICDEVRKGRRVVRLKGGDAGLFGRLSEEVEALDALGIPYLVRPGVSALTAATTPNGILLTKRGVAAGFEVSTPRSSGSSHPQVFFMASRMARETLRRFPPDMPYAMVWDACGPQERVETGLCGRPGLCMRKEPGLLVVGFAGAPFRQRRLLATCSESVMPHVVRMFEDRGFRVVKWPMVTLSPVCGVEEVLSGVESRCDAMVFTSPSAVRIFFSVWKGDVRNLPDIWTCGPGTDAELRRHGMASDMMPECEFSSDGLVERLKREKGRVKGLRVVRFRSARASKKVAAALRRIGAKVEDVELYSNEPVERRGLPLPAFDAVHFASSSAVEAFLGGYGAKALSGKDVFVAGAPTVAALPAGLRRRAKVVPFGTDERFVDSTRRW